MTQKQVTKNQATRHSDCSLYKIVSLALTLLFLPNALHGEGLLEPQLAPALSPAQPSSLHVFFPTNLHSLQLEEKLKARCPSLDITVFGRPKDIIKSLAMTKPMAVITLPALSVDFEDFLPKLQGIKNNSAFEPLFFVSLKPLTLVQIQQGAVGTIDFLGRQKMLEYIETLLDHKFAIKRVRRNRDLLALLRFELADSVLITQSDFEAIKKTTQLRLYVLDSNQRLKRAQLALLHQADNQLNLSTTPDTFVRCVLGFETAINQLLLTHSWRAL